jgi:carbonic anhydrase
VTRPKRTIDVVYRFDPDHPARRAPPRTPVEALRRLRRGNRAFAELVVSSRALTRIITLDPSDVGHGVEPGIAPAQHPFAAVLGCSDARVPIEMVFQQRSGDLFVVRVAGNGLGTGCIGGLRYAAYFAQPAAAGGARTSQCGAVTAAVIFSSPGAAFRSRLYAALDRGSIWSRCAARASRSSPPTPSGR